MNTTHRLGILWTAAVMIFLVNTGSAQVAGQRRPQPLTLEEMAQRMPPEVELLPNVVYGTGGGRPLHMHIVRPKQQPAQPMPAIVFIHGGAWMAGNAESAIPALVQFARSGYFCATVEYRLSQEAVFPAQIEDCKCAIRFLHAKAKEYDIDPDRIGVWGSSAGGHLVALLGTSGGVKELEGKGGWSEYSSRVAAVCDWFGPTDFLKIGDFPSNLHHMAPDSPESRLLGGPVTELTNKAREASPLTYITADDPPFLIMHGDKDMIVPLNQSQLLYDALKQAGVEATFHIVKGAGHGFGGPENFKLVRDFFAKHLEKPQAAGTAGTADARK